METTKNILKFFYSLDSEENVNYNLFLNALFSIGLTGLSLYKGKIPTVKILFYNLLYGYIFSNITDMLISKSASIIGIERYESDHNNYQEKDYIRKTHSRLMSNNYPLHNMKHRRKKNNHRNKIGSGRISYNKIHNVKLFN